MVKGLIALDNELESQQRRIEQLEAELFFERLRLVGLKNAKGHCSANWQLAVDR